MRAVGVSETISIIDKLIQTRCSAANEEHITSKGIRAHWSFHLIENTSIDDNHLNISLSSA